jgi:hypothetical protein
VTESKDPWRLIVTVSRTICHPDLGAELLHPQRLYVARIVFVSDDPDGDISCVEVRTNPDGSPPNLRVRVAVEEIENLYDFDEEYVIESPEP